MVFIDQMNRQCVLARPPKRIVSLVPSQSELLWDLGLQDELVGITKFCIHPDEMYRSVTRIGGTKQLDIEKIISLQPDLIIGNKEENTKEQIEALEKLFPVWMSDINSIGEALIMIDSIAEIFGKGHQGQLFNLDICAILKQFEKKAKQKKIIYLIWSNPYISVGQSTFINNMCEHFGFVNCITQARYPEITLEEIKHLSPDYIFLSTEPFPFSDKHVDLFKEQIPDSKCVLVDGDFFSWYGSRLAKSEDYFSSFFDQLHHE